TETRRLARAKMGGLSSAEAVVTKGITGTRVLLILRNGGQWGSRQRESVLRRSTRPASRFSHRCVRESVQRAWAVATKGCEVLGRAVTFVLREAILRIDLVELLHAAVAF